MAAWGCSDDRAEETAPGCLGSLLALAAIYDGATRTEAAEIGGVTLQVIRDWVLKFNARDPDRCFDTATASSRRGCVA
jgi:hypothetical protein